jgi:hypothetical protein
MRHVDGGQECYGVAGAETWGVEAVIPTTMVT